MDRLTRRVLRHKRLVVLSWLVVMIAGAAAASTTTARLKSEFALPGQQGDATANAFVEEYGNSAAEGVSLVVVSSAKDEPVAAVAPAVDGLFRAIQERFPQYRVAWRGNTGKAEFETADGRIAYGLVFDSRPDDPVLDRAYVKIKGLLAAQAADNGLKVRTSGYNELAAGAGPDAAQSPGVLAETLVGGVGALVVLIFVFASFLAFAPLIVAIVSILATFLALLGVTYLTDVNMAVQFLVALVGLGLAIDYSLLVITRWREETRLGLSNEEAVLQAMRTAGRSVLTSAAIVAISLTALIAVPVPFLRSLGAGGMLIAVISALVVTTLLPAVLAGVGPKIDWPRGRRSRVGAGSRWSAWAGAVERRKWLAAAAGTLALGVLVVPVFGMNVGLTHTGSLVSEGAAYQSLRDLTAAGAPSGAISPLEVLVRGDDPGRLAKQVADRLDGVDGVAFTAVPDDAASQHDATAVVEVVPHAEITDDASAMIVDRMLDATADLDGIVGIAGSGAFLQDYRSAVTDRLPWVVGLIALATFLLLARAFRSVLLAAKAVLLNVLSVAATFGFVVWFWQHGHGGEQLFGVPATGSVMFWLPVVIFAYLFGLSMDYEVFILTRMREEYDRSGSTRTAIIEGLGRTGRLVTSAALILFLSFVAMASAPATDIKVLATALGIGILLDATVVRAILVPALVALLGRWNWWMPDRLGRLLRIPPPSIADAGSADLMRQPAGAR